MTQLATFASDWASPPGATISDLLASRRMTLAELARHLGETPQLVEALLSGRILLTAPLADGLAKTLGGSSRFWLAREREYRETTARIAAQSMTAPEWLRTLPLRDMIARGWLRRERSPERQAAVALEFFGCESLAQWHGEYSRLFAGTAYRTSSSFQSHTGALAAWLRRGELAAATVECDPWSPAHFEAAIPVLRSLTRLQRPDSFLPRLRAACASCGVAVIVARAPEGCRASGATRFLSATKALLLLSFRYLSDDQFWFAFFHEAGHLLLHDLDSIFVEEGRLMDVNESYLEREADQFAARILVPEPALERMLALPHDTREIVRFAREIGIAPGIVVGQLQHHGRLAYSQMNRLKRRYQWEESGLK